MIIPFVNKPTDAEYIQAFRANNTSITDRFLRENMGLFIGTIKKKFTIKIEGAYEEIYQESLVRLWTKIYEDEDFEKKIYGKLINYLIGMGIQYAKEYIRKNEKILHQIKQKEEDINDGLDQFVDMDTVEDVDKSFKPLTISPEDVWEEAKWIDEVENPYEKFVRQGHSLEECIDEWTRLAEQYEKGQHQKSPLSRKPEDADYRVEIIKNVVDNMGKPCAPLLIKFYGNERKSWEIIANELKYSGADSAKTQKNKCMGKLKKIVETQIKSYKL